MTEEKIKSAEPYHRLLQCLIILLANHRAGIKITEDFRPNLIFKFEGGVKVNGCEIVVKKDYDGKIHCYDDFKYERRAESEITEKVVNDLLEKIDWTRDDIQNQVESFVLPEIGLDSETLTSICSKFCSNPYGDPLRSLFKN